MPSERAEEVAAGHKIGQLLLLLVVLPLFFCCSRVVVLLLLLCCSRLLELRPHLDHHAHRFLWALLREEVAEPSPAVRPDLSLLRRG